MVSTAQPLAGGAAKYVASDLPAGVAPVGVHVDDEGVELVAIAPAPGGGVEGE